MSDPKITHRRLYLSVRQHALLLQTLTDVVGKGSGWDPVRKLIWSIKSAANVGEEEAHPLLALDTASGKVRKLEFLPRRKEYRVVLDALPGPHSGQFVELEDETGAGLGGFEWTQRDDGYCELRLPIVQAPEEGSPEDRMEALSKELGEPVMRISAYCKAISTWFKVFQKKLRAEMAQSTSPYGATQAKVLAGSMRTIETNIRKSGLLARLIYGGEKLRTRECPEHKGKMDPGMWSLGTGGPCPHGCQGSGWIPEPEDGGPPLAEGES